MQGTIINLNSKGPRHINVEILETLAEVTARNVLRDNEDAAGVLT